MQKVICLFCCYNRLEITKRAIESLLNEKNDKIDLEIIVVDDCSSDGTFEWLINNNLVECIKTDGNYFYSKSMNFGMNYILEKKKEADYLLIINDDVIFNKEFLTKMINYSKSKDNLIVIGPTCSATGKLTYGGIHYPKKYSGQIDYIGPDNNKKCDTFNANCVLIPFKYFVENPIIDKKYIHSMGDFDYGLMFKKNGYNMIVLNEYVGICERNNKANTWMDTKLSVKDRLKKMNLPKGQPMKLTFYYYKKNFGYITAFKCCLSLFISILLKK